MASVSISPPPHLYLDEKWKLSKKQGSARSCNRLTPSPTSHLMRNSSSSSSVSSSSSSSTCRLMRNSSKRRCSFTRKCASLVKEQRARFYIMRRCVTMLICWRDYSGDS